MAQLHERFGILRLGCELRAARRAGHPGLPADAGGPRAARALNHEHVFSFPLAEQDGLDLDRVTGGLGRAAEELKRDRAYGRRASEIVSESFTSAPTRALYCSTAPPGFKRELLDRLMS